MKYLLFVAVITAGLSACATYPDVRPGIKGKHRVVVKSENRREGVRDALRQARNYCDEDDKRPVVLREKIRYTGSMTEKDYRQRKGMARAGKVVGTGAAFLGGKRERKAGAIVGVGSAAGDAYLGEEYRIYIKFKCRK